MKLGEFLSHEPFESIDFLMYNFLLLYPFLLLPRHSYIIFNQSEQNLLDFTTAELLAISDVQVYILTTNIL